MPVTIKITPRYFARTAAPNAQLHRHARPHTRMSNILLIALLGYGVTTGALVAGALAASVLPAQAPLTDTSLIMLKSGNIEAETLSAQPMPPMPDHAYDAQFHEGAVDLDATTSFAGIDPFITGPAPK